MAYSTVENIAASFDEQYQNQLTDDVSGSAKDDAVIGACIDDADGLIDSYVGIRYTVPIATVPVDIRRCSVQITVYYLCLRRGWAVTDNIKAAYDEALKHLDAIRDGKAQVTGGVLKDAFTASFDGDDRTFTRDLMHGF